MPINPSGIDNAPCNTVGAGKFTSIAYPIWLPVNSDGQPDYDFIRQYMGERRYSGNLKEL
ncbi:MAG: hypothetical protein F4Z18_13515 [Caldilineaceae bacterium SB0666_bin_21]|nr:hypothetical protein [Caldilineaceae bacterium SB0666_bin_21]